MRRLLAFLVFAAILAGFVHIAEAEEEECIAQTWKGTIGNAPVMMDFSREGEDSALVGRYYYRSSLVDLLLTRDGSKPDHWKELDPKGKISGRLVLNCQDSLLSGTWTSPDGSKALPINAERQESVSFFTPRREGLKLTPPKRASIGKFQYESFTAQGVDSVKGLRLVGDGKPLADINRVLMEKFTGNLEEAITCKSLGRLRVGEDSGYGVEFELQTIDWNSSFVVIGQQSSNYCGQMHPMYDGGATTYNLRTGGEEDVSQWLIDRYRGEIPKDSPLGKTILDLYHSDEESCDDDTIELSGESAWPTSEGIVFRPSAAYANTACIQEVTVPYKSMSPYLSPVGKTNVQAFQQP